MLIDKRRKVQAKLRSLKAKRKKLPLVKVTVPCGPLAGNPRLTHTLSLQAAPQKKGRIPQGCSSCHQRRKGHTCAGDCEATDYHLCIAYVEGFLQYAMDRTFLPFSCSMVTHIYSPADHPISVSDEQIDQLEGTLGTLVRPLVASTTRACRFISWSTSEYGTYCEERRTRP